MTIRLTKELGLELCQWHSSMNDPIYAVGSSAIAGKCVSRELLEQALESLDSCWNDTELNPGRYTTETIEQLANTIHELELALMLDELGELHQACQKFYSSLDPSILQQAKDILSNIGKQPFNQNILLTLTSNLSHLLTEEQWVQAGELYGQYLD